MAKKTAKKTSTKATAKRYRQPSARRLLEFETADLIRLLRVDMSMRAIESATGVSRSMLSRIQSGERTQCTVQTYRAIATLAIDRKVI